MTFQLPNDLSALFLQDYDLVQEALCLQLAQKYPSEIKVQRRPYLIPTPSKNELVTDIAWLGPKDAKRVLTLISGTHGVEAYCGSAVQRFLLSQLALGNIVLPKDTAVLVVHALNPWGMAWARRCDERGIDLNRNFVDFLSTLPAVHAHYKEMLACLEESDEQKRKAGLLEMKKRLGDVEYDRCLSGGQYTHSWAPFFGGVEPSLGHQTVNSVIQEFSLAEKELVVIDLHTGLGPWGFGEIISDHTPNSKGETYAQKLFGAGLAVPARGTSFSVPKWGLQDYHWHPLMERAGCFITLEFGTYPTENLFDVLIADHQYWLNHAPKNLQDTKWQAQRCAMLNHFCPQDKAWQQAVLFKSWQVCQRVLDNWSE